MTSDERLVNKLEGDIRAISPVATNAHEMIEQLEKTVAKLERNLLDRLALDDYSDERDYVIIQCMIAFIRQGPRYQVEGVFFDKYLESKLARYDSFHEMSTDSHSVKAAILDYNLERKSRAGHSA